MNILSEFDLEYNNNFLSTITAPCNSGKSAVFEKIMIDYIDKGFDCLYIGENNNQSFCRRMKRKMNQYKYEYKENHGKIIYKMNHEVLNELYFEKLIKIHRPKVVFLDCFFEKHLSLNKLYNIPKSLLLEKTIKIEKQNTRNLDRREIERTFYMDLRLLMNKYKLSIYVNKPMNRTNGIHQDIHQDGEIISIIGGAVPYSMMESDIVFTVSRGDNYINTKINIVKNRFGKENKSVEVLL
jgi:hypothetical protein